MLQNRQNQVTAVQIAARRNLNQVALVAGTPHFLSMPKHRLYWSMYGKRPISPTLPQSDSKSDPQDHAENQLRLGSGSGHCHCSRLRSTAGDAVNMLHQSERQCVVSRQSESSRQSTVSHQSTGHRSVGRVPNVPVINTSRASVPTAVTPVWQIPATAWAAFAIQKAIRG